MRHFASGRYDSVVEINFVERPEFLRIADGGFSAKEIVRRISLVDPSLRFVPGGTLLFFDEIQAFPEIATSLKSFAQDGRFDVIASGSLLGVHYKRIASHSMGYKTDVEMNALDFEEVLWALGYDAGFVEEIYAHLAERRPFEALERDVLRERFRDFCVLGGMPEVVSGYLEKKTFEGSLDLQRSLVDGWRDDRHLIPVEVKATNGRSRSLRTLINDKRHPDISWGIKFGDVNVGFQNRILTLPRFTAFLLARLLADGVFARPGCRISHTFPTLFPPETW